MTAQTLTSTRSERERQLGPGALALLRKFPPRPVPSAWPATDQPSDRVLERLLAPPFALDIPATQARRRVGLGKILRWLEQQPGQSWQDRWLISGADAAGNSAWRHLVTEWLRRNGLAYASPKNDFVALGGGILPLICGEVIRPSLSWLLTPGTVQILTAEMARTRDPEGFAALVAVCRKDPANTTTKDGTLRRIATIMAAKGGKVGDITAGDCVEMVELLQSMPGTVSTAQRSGPCHQPQTGLLFLVSGAPEISPKTGLATKNGAKPNFLTCENAVARHDHGTALSGFLPGAWDHLVASDGTTRRVAPWGLIASGIRSVHVMRRGGSVDGVSGCREGCCQEPPTRLLLLVTALIICGVGLGQEYRSAASAAR